MATKQPRPKTMKVGRSLGQQHQRSRKPMGSKTKEPKSERKHVEDDKENEDHYDDKICMLCCEEIDVVAKGQCNHVICYKCSSRMRAICNETYCAVCRHELKKVVFTEQNIPFAEMKLKGLPSEEKHGIVFQDENIKKKFKDLLMNACPVCKVKNASFDELKRHVRHKHEKQYCDICVKNLKVFPKELRIYSRTELVEHRKTGDRDDTSHKGHPMCNFCNDRYYDNDELLLHLRRNHFWCHFCENDGKQDYYCNYDDLRSHFRDDHFLCEEKECILEKYTSVFRSDIDLKAHRLAKHSKKLSKVATKQARQVNVEIDYGKRRTYRDKVYNDRNPKKRQEMAAQRMAMDNEISEGDSEATALSDTSKESVHNTTTVSNGTEPGNADMTGKSLNAKAPIFVPLEAATGATEVPSLADETSDPAKNLKAEEVGKQWSRVIMGPVGHDYGADFPSISNGGARPKTSPPLRCENSKKADKTAKRAPVNHNKSQNDKPKALLDNKKVATPPPGLDRSNSAHKMLPPGMNISSNTSLNSTNVASSAPPGLGQTSSIDKSKTGRSAQERNATLVGLIKSLLSDESFDRFRNQSGRFRRSEIDDSTYYNFIRELFAESLDIIFNELVDLLPEREKQIQLLKLHGTIGTTKSSKLESKPITKSKVAWQQEGAGLSSAGIVLKGKDASSKKSGVIPDASSQGNGNASSRDHSQAIMKKQHKDSPVCNVCGIPFSRKELERHMVIHTELDFPALPTTSLPQKTWRKNASQNPVPNAWAKSA